MRLARNRMESNRFTCSFEKNTSYLSLPLCWYLPISRKVFFSYWAPCPHVKINEFALFSDKMEAKSLIHHCETWVIFQMGPFFGPVKWFSFSMEKPSKKLRNSAAPPGSGRLRWFCQWQWGWLGLQQKLRGIWMTGSKKGGILVGSTVTPRISTTRNWGWLLGMRSCRDSHGDGVGLGRLGGMGPNAVYGGLFRRRKRQKRFTVQSCSEANGSCF